MNIGLLNILHNKEWDFRPDMAQAYANALKNAIEMQLDNDLEKKQGYFLSKKGYQKDGRTVGANFEDKLYVGNIHRIERHLYWNDEELADDDQIINVIVVDGPVTRDGGGCSYGTKDFRDQVMYANTIPQVVGHIFVINTPGGEASCRNDYEMMIDDCRKYGKPTVAFVDGMCCSSGVNLASRCDRVIVMNPKDEFGCIGTMAAFWAVAHDTVDQDGYRYVELVGDDCPEKNAWWRDAAKGDYEKLQADLNRDTDAFHQSVRENRPLVTDDMLSGKAFQASEVIPALVDEIGDYNRAIECVFQLADEQMQAARFATAPAGGDPGDDPEDDPKEPEEMAKLNAQQKAAVNTSRGDLMMAEDGHVTKEVPGFFGPETVEVAKPQNDKDMTDEEKKAAEAQEAQAAQEQAQQEQQAEEGAQQGQQSEEGAQQEQHEGAQDEHRDEEGAKQGQQPGEGAQQEQAPASQEDIKNAQEEIDKIRETLHNAEQMVAERDKEISELTQQLNDTKGEMLIVTKDRETLREKKDEEIEGLNSQLTTLNSQLSEKDAEIEKLTKQIADLKAEVKELAGGPAPMTSGAEGVPAGNGTGEGPKDMGSVKSEITPEMSVDEIRQRLRKKDEKQKTYRH